jgi:hypothetical protein
MGKQWHSWYYSMVAALCMVLYGYDASVFNSLQGSQNWLDWVDLDLDVNTHMLGLSWFSSVYRVHKSPRALLLIETL